MSSAFSHLAITTVATPLPTRLVNARASDMRRSMPRINAMLATGIGPTLANVPASTIKKHFLILGEKAQNADPGRPGARAHHTKKKDQARRVERRHQLGEGGQGAD